MIFYIKYDKILYAFQLYISVVVNKGDDTSMWKNGDTKVFNAPEGRKIVRAQILNDGKSVVIYTERIIVREVVPDTEIVYENFEELFPVVKASELSINDAFMQHIPETEKQRKFKESLTNSIKAGLRDFRKPIIDPSFRKDGKIIFKKGEPVANYKSAQWWAEALKNVMPSKNSRMGTKTEYEAFAGCLIKELIEELKYTTREAWRVICDDSTNLGNYLNSPGANKYQLESTGSRQVGKWYDLANVCKTVYNDNMSGFCAAGSHCKYRGTTKTISEVNPSSDRYGSCWGTGWMVLDI